MYLYEDYDNKTLVNLSRVVSRLATLPLYLNVQ